MKTISRKKGDGFLFDRFPVHKFKQDFPIVVSKIEIG